MRSKVYKYVAVENFVVNTWQHMMVGGPGSSVGIANGYVLDGPRIESRFGSRFSAPVQTDPGAHPASCAMVTGSFLEVKSGRA